MRQSNFVWFQRVMQVRQHFLLNQILQVTVFATNVFSRIEAFYASSTQDG